MSFLFGNISFSGDIENEELDNEIKQILKNTNLSEIIGDQLKIVEGGEDKTAKLDDGKIEPLASAVDMEDEVEEEIEAEDEEAKRQQEAMKDNWNQKFSKMSQEAEAKAALNNPEAERDIKIEKVLKFYPDFAPGKTLKFTSLIPSFTYAQDKKRKLNYYKLQNKQVSFMPNDLLLFNKEIIEEPEEKKEVQVTREVNKSEEISGLLGIELNEWENEILWDENSKPEKKRRLDFNTVPDYDLEIGDWENEIFWDENDAAALKNRRIEIPMNDYNLIIDVVYPNNKEEFPEHFLKASAAVSSTTHAVTLLAQNMANANKTKNAAVPKRGRPAISNVTELNEKKEVIVDKFNLSGDRYYDHKIKRVRQLLGKIAPIQHLLPAMRLSLPYYRRFMTKQEMRMWHRPQLKINYGTVKFTRMKNIIKKQIQDLQRKKVTMHDLVHNVTDITLADNGNYILLEYSEEYPPLIENVGMESLFINYYRKKDDKDSYMPKLVDGMPVILEHVDASPFFGFGDCFKGETVQAFKNNLFIVPVFPNRIYEEDFLFIRRRGKEYSHFIREIQRVYIAGQMYPLQEVQPPHSRKTKSIVRARLTVAAFRKFKRKGPQTRYAVNKIVNTYHRYHEQSVRKHFKTMFELQKNSKGKLFLALRPGVRIPSEQELLKMCTPEMVCMFESTRVGQQRLADAGTILWKFTKGYGALEMNENQEEEEESKLDDEIQLAPWNSTKNFLLAAQNKGMVKLYGSGDPTGRGEGFSFFRASMKLMFMREGASAEEEKAYFESQMKTGHKFALADQKKFYQEEIERIWNVQRKSLSCLDEIEFDDFNKATRVNTLKDEDMNESEQQDFNSIMQMVNSPVHSQSQGELHDGASVTSSSAQQEQRRGKKALLIKRKLKDGSVQEEMIMDPAVIVAYRRRKLLINATIGTRYEIDVEDDEITMRNNAAAAIRSHRRLFGAIKYKQQPKQERMKDGTIRMGYAKRKCKSCGQVGHISTNSICPDYAKNNPDSYKKKSVGLVHTKGSKLFIPKSAIEHVVEKRKKDMTVKINLKGVSGGEASKEESMEVDKKEPGNSSPEKKEKEAEQKDD